VCAAPTVARPTRAVRTARSPSRSASRCAPRANETGKGELRWSQFETHAEWSQFETHAEARAWRTGQWGGNWRSRANIGARDARWAHPSTRADPSKPTRASDHGRGGGGMSTQSESENASRSWPGGDGVGGGGGHGPRPCAASRRAMSLGVEAAWTQRMGPSQRGQCSRCTAMSARVRASSREKDSGNLDAGDLAVNSASSGERWPAGARNDSAAAPLDPAGQGAKIDRWSAARRRSSDATVTRAAVAPFWWQSSRQ